jgi:flavin reductase (DIM6/NTAB) family NADH-FMN oxidoreductase RutF
MDDQHALVDARQFREVCGQYATGVAIITACGEGGEPVGLTVNSFSSVSLDPPLIQFSLDRKASMFSLFEDCSHFAVNVLSRSQQPLSNMFAVRHDAFEDVVYSGGAGGCPILEDCLASLECAKYAVYDGGDHIIILGRVVNLDCAPSREPLLFFRGTYGSFS